MKNIMKKAVALFVVAAMLCIPVFTNAAVGDTVPMPENYIWNGDVVEVAAGATTYFEISTDTIGIFDFVVEGTGDFSVAVCTEGYSDDTGVFYTEGTPVASVDGKVETKIESFEYSYYCAAFSITNNTDADAAYTCTIVYPVGSMGNPFEVELSLDASAEVTIAAGETFWIGANLPEAYKEYAFTITGATGFSYTDGWMGTSDNNGVYEGTIASYFGPATFAIVNETADEQTYTLSIGNMPIGSEGNPDPDFTVGTAYELDLDGAAYWYSWTAPEDGTFTFTVDTSITENWTYNVVNNETYATINYSTAWDEHDYYTNTLDVYAGDVISIGVSIPAYVAEYESWDAYTFGTGTFAFTTSFEAGTVGGDDSGDSGDDDQNNENVDDALDVGENYIHYGAAIYEGTDTYSVSNLYEYTLFSFCPAEEGKYTFASSDALIGIVSYNGMWVSITPDASTVASTTLEWSCTSVGQEIWIAVLAETNAAEITVVKGDLVIKEIEKIEYQNIKTPEKFTFTGDAEALLYVDTFDGINDTAVLGADGYYHLNSENGPVLYANINDTMMSLATANDYGQLKYIIYNEDGEAETIIDYTIAMIDYLAAMDEDTCLYPLTADLIEIFSKAGENLGWYGASGWVGGEEADAWMFACYYDENDVTADDNGNNDANNGDANNGDANNGDANNGAGTDNNGNVVSPDAGDDMFVIIAVAVVAVAAAATLLVIRRRRSAK